MTARSPAVFLVDVDNTLFDDDHIATDLKRYLRQAEGFAVAMARCRSAATSIRWSIRSKGTGGICESRTEPASAIADVSPQNDTRVAYISMTATRVPA
jgi:hypothetical protein